ncbi:hypothetical protein HMPREF2531_05596 [Bacteroides intestinalis]|uniref:Uncharacterized protein n=2 Tax=Bacteroides TaxID=816 RepID=A0A139KM35_9BACE|nr:hypothetical protein BACCELL_04005 [Bacteroides cellulosilyticus DSM 14838]KXT40258.1 hypothetical protein HMPREF2531_05596 [Bacteroides intestinalis]
MDAKINDLYLAYKLFRLFLNKEKYSPFSTLFRRIRKNSIR